MKHYYIETFGCQMNEFDSERIAYLLEQKGYLKCNNIKESDIIILNTCAVREKAKNRQYGHIGNLKKLKEMKPDLIIAIGGCTAQNIKDKILKDFPFIDIVFGTNNISEIPFIIDKKKSSKKRICSIIENKMNYQLDNSKRTFNFKAHIPIIIGCNNFCSYCIVPYVRGKEESIKYEEIINYAKRIVSEGVLEITLLGQNVNSYIGQDENNEPVYFPDLLKELAKIKNLKRIRFLTSHPKDFSDELIEVIKNNQNIARHIHLPLQSGSDKILKAMNRKYTGENYLDIIRKIKNEIPDCSITTDIIVGFPGELKEDFMDTLRIIKEARFDRSFTFIYSKREKTTAAELEDPIPLEEKKKWFIELINNQNIISLENNLKHINKNFEVLVEGRSMRGLSQLEGRLENNLIVNFKGPGKLIGKLLNVKITDAGCFYLIGEMN